MAAKPVPTCNTTSIINAFSKFCCIRVASAEKPQSVPGSPSPKKEDILPVSKEYQILEFLEDQENEKHALSLRRGFFVKDFRKQLRRVPLKIRVHAECHSHVLDHQQNNALSCKSRDSSRKKRTVSEWARKRPFSFESPVLAALSRNTSYKNSPELGNSPVEK